MQATPDTTVIRAATDGRLRYSPAQRQDLLDAFDRSGMSAMAFARQHGVHYQTFIAWRRKLREGIGSTNAVPAFAEVVLDQAATSGPPLRVILPCGSIIEISSRAALPLLVELLSNLRRPC